VNPQRTTNVADQWQISNSWKLAECFIPDHLLWRKTFTWRCEPSTFSFDNCDPSQLLHIYKNCIKFPERKQRLSKEVLEVKNELIGHLPKLDDVSCTLYFYSLSRIRVFREELNKPDP